MHILRSLVFIVPFIALTLALPSISSSRNALKPRDDTWSHGIPANGVSCSTVTETNHVLDNGTITAAITAGVSNQFASSKYGTENIFYPKSFNSSQIGTDPTGSAYTIKWAFPGCATASTLYYVPVSYPGFSAPAYSGNSVTVVVGGGSIYPDSPPTPASPISSDIVVFVITSVPNALNTNTAVRAVLCCDDEFGCSYVGFALRGRSA